MDDLVDLVIIGGGTGAREVAGIIADINASRMTYNVLGVLDDAAELKTVFGMNVLGAIDIAEDLQGVKFVFAIGSIATQLNRNDILERTGLDEDRFETLVHPSAIIDNSAKIGRGCIIHPRVTIGHYVMISDFVIIAVGSTLGPGVAVARCAMITSHVLILSHSQVGELVFIGAGACIVEGVSLGLGCRVGVGSIVSKSVRDFSIALGNPARVIGLNNN